MYVYVCMYVCVCVCVSGSLFNHPCYLRNGCDTRSIFNGYIDFSLAGCLTNDKEPTQPHYLPLAGNTCIHSFS